MNVAVGSKLYAQSNTIAVKGKVMADGEPVIGATVLVKGVSTGTATDMDGNFSLNVASKAVLVVSSIGYETQEVPVNGRQFINVVLKSDVVTLKDVVVVGYGVQKKVNLTGAVSSVSTDELEGKPISNVLEAMQGTTPGLVIQQGSSTPGMDSLKLAAIVTHVADSRTCVLHPASHTHRQLTDEQLMEAGVRPDLIRFSVGTEAVEDIIADLKQALEAIR